MVLETRKAEESVGHQVMGSLTNRDVVSLARFEYSASGQDENGCQLAITESREAIDYQDDLKMNWRDGAPKFTLDHR